MPQRRVMDVHTNGGAGFLDVFKQTHAKALSRGNAAIKN
jgi:hypothetical protein